MKAMIFSQDKHMKKDSWQRAKGEGRYRKSDYPSSLFFQFLWCWRMLRVIFSRVCPLIYFANTESYVHDPSHLVIPLNQHANCEDKWQVTWKRLEPNKACPWPHKPPVLFNGTDYKHTLTRNLKKNPTSLNWLHQQKKSYYFLNNLLIVHTITNIAVVI